MKLKLSGKLLQLLTLVLVVALIAGCGAKPAAPPAAKPAADKPAASTQIPPGPLKFATQSLGTSMYVYASTMGQLVTPVLPQGYTINVQTTSPGGVAAPYLIAEKKAELALGNAAPAKWAIDGTMLNRPPVKGVTALVGGLDAPVMLVVFTDAFVKKTGIKNMEELVAKKHPVKIAIKAVGALGEMACKEVLDTFGVKYETIKTWGGSVTHTGAPQVTNLLRDGQADITIDHVGVGQAAISELAMTSNIHFIQLSDDTIKKLNAKGWNTVTMPANTWKGQTNNIKTLSSGVVLLASADLPDAVAYAITKKLCESKTELGAAYAAMKEFDPATAWTPLKNGAPLHPGAAKYYKEKGYMK